MSAETISYKHLLAGTFPRQTKKVCILSSAALTAGAVLGQIKTAAVTCVGAAAAGNTGNGVITAAPVATTAAKVGVHRLVMLALGSNVGTGVLFDPDGVELGRVVVAAEAVLGGITFTLADGSTDAAIGDAWTLTVAKAEGSLKYIKAASAAVDGSAAPCAILMEDADASAGDAFAVVALSGSFNQNALNFGTGTTLANSRAALEALNIYSVPTDENVNV